MPQTPLKPLNNIHVKTSEDWHNLKNWRRRGFRSESRLVTILIKNGFNAVRIPVSNPSLSPLPDIIARKGDHMFAFEVKNVTYYAYYEKKQQLKLFEFLRQFTTCLKEYKHAVLASHMGKQWRFKELEWDLYENQKLENQVRILKRDRGNFKLEQFGDINLS